MATHIKVKFCGIRSQQDIAYANETEPDYVGFVFADSRRQVTPEEAGRLRLSLKDGIQTVGVFVNENPKTVADIAKRAGLDVVQLHGDEDDACIDALRKLLPNAEIWKAVRAADEAAILAAGRYQADRLLVDSFSQSAYGGTGKTADWQLLARCKRHLERGFFLAGGLDADNLEQAMQMVGPYGVDISSGIETGGVKDLAKMRRIIQIARRQ